MGYPSWISYCLAGLMAAIAAYCISRLVLARKAGGWDHVGTMVSHVLMAVAMAGMLVPGWYAFGRGWAEPVFALLAAWFLVSGARLLVSPGSKRAGGASGRGLSHHLGHVATAVTMIYMYSIGMPAGAARAGMVMRAGGAGSGAASRAADPGLTLALVLVLLVSAVWQLDTIGAPATSGGPGACSMRRSTPRRLDVCCHVAMCIVMAYMLVLAI